MTETINKALEDRYRENGWNHLDFGKTTNVVVAPGGEDVLLYSSKQIDSLITYMEALEFAREERIRTGKGFEQRVKLVREINNCNKHIDAWFKVQAETGKSVLEIEFGAEIDKGVIEQTI